MATTHFKPCILKLSLSGYSPFEEHVEQAAEGTLLFRRAQTVCIKILPCEHPPFLVLTACLTLQAIANLVSDFDLRCTSLVTNVQAQPVNDFDQVNSQVPSMAPK